MKDKRSVQDLLNEWGINEGDNDYNEALGKELKKLGFKNYTGPELGDFILEKKLTEEQVSKSGLNAKEGDTLKVKIRGMLPPMKTIVSRRDKWQVQITYQIESYLLRGGKVEISRKDPMKVIKDTVKDIKNKISWAL